MVIIDCCFGDFMLGWLCCLLWCCIGLIVICFKLIYLFGCLVFRVVHRSLLVTLFGCVCFAMFGFGLVLGHLWFATCCDICLFVIGCLCLCLLFVSLCLGFVVYGGFCF